MNIIEFVDFKDTDSSRERSLKTEKSATFNIFRPPDKKCDFIKNLSEKPEIVEYKIYDITIAILLFFLNWK